MHYKLKVTTIAVTAFLSGILTHSQIYAQKIKEQPRTVPAVQTKPRKVRLGKASWYSERSPGINKRTANNEYFDDSDLTCAIWGVEFNQKIKVTNLNNGKSIVVRVNDRGPHKRYVRRGRIIDLTKGAFAQISTLRKGLINVEIEFL